jgi:protoporphyrin/coproporphyrin ferrochelatase
MPVVYQAVFLIAFGGPAAPEEVRPFIKRVLRGHPVAAERIEEVARHYEAVGGRSPLNDIVLRQARVLGEELANRGLPLPVYVGLRHARPFLRETLDQMTADGVRKALGFILSPQQTEASWERYQREIAEAQVELGYAPEVDYCPGWHAHPLLIQAWAEQISPVMSRIATEKRSRVPIIFTAHSVPRAMAADSPYVEQIEETARLVAERVGCSLWYVAYQSRSGRPEDPWLEPDIADALQRVAAQGGGEVVVVPVGFVADHVEILYDLDIAARRHAESLRLRFRRAPSLNDHPTFVRMMAEVIGTAAG